MPHSVDTNIVPYAVSTDPTEASKHAIADEIFDRRDLVVSAQVLGGFYVQATRPSRSGSLTHQQAADVVASLGRYPAQPLTNGLVTAALALRDRYRSHIGTPRSSRPRAARVVTPSCPKI